MAQTLKLKINTQHAAFHDTGDGGVGECARLLAEISSKLLAGKTEGKLIDYNGNHCGDWKLTP